MCHQALTVLEGIIGNSILTREFGIAFPGWLTKLRIFQIFVLLLEVLLHTTYPLFKKNIRLLFMLFLEFTVYSE